MSSRILYFHGFASSPQSGKAGFFAAQFRSRGIELEIPDLAAGDFEHLTITGQLALIERIVNGEPVSLIGSSLGGYLAALYAARNPAVRKLILLAPGFGFARRWPEWLGPEKLERWRTTRVMDVFHYGEGRERALRYDILDDAMAYEDYPDFRQPALIFHGTHDETVPARVSEEFAAAHPNVRLELLDSGHDLHNVLDYMGTRALDFLLDGYDGS